MLRRYCWVQPHFRTDINSSSVVAAAQSSPFTQSDEQSDVDPASISTTKPSTFANSNSQAVVTAQSSSIAQPDESPDPDLSSDDKRVHGRFLVLGALE